jgi:PAS domain S-box-containing protein
VLTLAATGGKVFLPPHVDILGIVLFLFISLLVSRVATNRKRIEQVLRSANAQLESRVKERTAELRFANAAIRQANLELQKNEEQFRALANAIPQLCWMSDAAGAALWCNERWTVYTGTTIEQMQNSGWKSVHDPSMLAAVNENWEKSLATARPFEMEFPLRGADGQFRWFLTRILPVMDDSGNAARWFGTATDIDELKRSREALIESEARFRAMADSAPVMIWISEIDRTFTWFNKAWLEFTGRTMHQEIDLQWSAGIHPEDRQRCIDTYTSSFDARKEFAMEYRRRRRDGGWRWVLSHGVPRRGADAKFSGFIGCCFDINDRREMEENLRHANSDLQQFAYSASHDLQEPIRMVAIYSQLIGRQYGPKLDGNGQLFLEYLTTAAQRMERLVRDLLFYTQTGSIEVGESERANANDVLSEVLADLSAVVSEVGACVTNDPLPTLSMYAVHLQQLFQNLIGNAIKYRGDKAPSIHVSARELNGCWLFSVQDNGIGIDPAYKERIFGIFKRLHTNDKYSGTGIGLAICQRIVERYRGRIWVESEPGRGSTFFFTIPV